MLLDLVQNLEPGDTQSFPPEPCRCVLIRGHKARVSEDGVAAEAKVKKEIFKDGTVLTLKMERGYRNQRIQTASIVSKV